ncbi:O-antigen ligase family protein [Roseobacter sp.]|uniref:O-antigen ligase family protein n=1 Tax=Roseobacter sp. TaxID=1907202 RepID=UPI003297B23C
MAVVTLAVVVETRGPLLVLLGLVVIRLCFVLTSDIPAVRRMLQAAALVGACVAGLSPLVLNADREARVVSLLAAPDQMSAAQNHSNQTEQPASAPILMSPLNERMAMLSAGWQAYKAAPFLGYGAQHRFDAAVPYLPDEFRSRYSHLHNEFLTHAVAGGIPAVLLLIALLVVPLVAAAQHRGGGRRRKIEIGLLATAAFTGMAAVNNVLFVDISAFSLGLSYVTVLLLIEADWSGKMY